MRATERGSPSTGILLVVLASLLWGTTGTAATFAPDAGPLAVGAAALGLAGLLMAALAAGSIRRTLPALCARWRTLLVGGLSLAVYPLAFYSSMRLAGVAIGTVVSIASGPIAAGILERVIDRRRLGLRWWLAAGLGVAGSTLLSGARAHGTADDNAATLAGIGLGLVAGVTYAAYSWAAARLMSAGVPRRAAMGGVFGIAGVLLLPVLLASGAPLVATPEAFCVAVYMALIPMFLGHTLFGMGLARVSASTATTVSLVEPAAATLLAVLVVGERLSALGWIGLALIGAAVVLLSLPARHAPPAAETTHGDDHRSVTRFPA